MSVAWNKSWGQIAYEAWGTAHDWPNGFPSWDEMPAPVKPKWEAVGLAVMRAYRLAKEET